MTYSFTVTYVLGACLDVSVELLNFIQRFFCGLSYINSTVTEKE